MTPRMNADTSEEMTPFGGALEPPGQEQMPQMGEPAMPESVLGSDVPPGQQILPERMKQAEHLAENPHAEANFRGKQDFHETMRGFDQRDAANRGSMLALDPNDPSYLQKLAAHQAQEGMLKSEKAHFEKMHPWGTPESAHPGVLGKIGHIAGEVGQISGSAFAPQIVAEIPGTQANLGERAAAGQAEENTAIGNEEKANLGEEQKQKGRLESAQADVAKNPKPEKPENPQQILADAISDAQARGVDPATDPHVKQVEDAIQSIQKEPQPKTQNDFEQYYGKWLKDNNFPDTSHNRTLARAEWAKAEQAPQRAPITEVVLPGGQIEAAKPGMTLPPGTQNIGGFAQLNRPTTQERNVGAQAAIAAQGIPQVTAEITKLGDQLGPVMGRWNDFMQGRVGMDNPQFAGLRADLLMVSSAVALAHARGRLPENLRAEFDKMINSPKQTPENLNAVLNHILPWMQRMENIGGNETPGTTPNAAPPKKWNAIKGRYE